MEVTYRFYLGGRSQDNENGAEGNYSKMAMGIGHAIAVLAEQASSLPL